MKKIYLGTADKEISELQSIIKSLLPSATIESINNKEQVHQVLKLPFRFCIVTPDFLDISRVENMELTGKVIIIDPSPTYKTQNKNINICSSHKDVDMIIRMSQYSNFVFDKTKIEESPKEKVEKQSQGELEDPLLESNLEIQEVNEAPPTQENPIEENIKKPLIDDKSKNIEQGNTTESQKKPKVIVNDKPDEHVEKKTKVKSPDKSATSKTKTNQNSPNLSVKGVEFGKAMDQYPFKNKKTIGVWAPLQSGVTSFIINFALFLQEYDVPISVVEMPRKNQPLHEILERYGTVPPNWVSLIENLSNSSEPNNHSLWLYRGVRWFPLGVRDLDCKRNKEFMKDFFLAVKRTEYVLVDLESGSDSPSTMDSLEHLDALWVFVDNRFRLQSSWKEFYQKLHNEHNLPIKLIYNRHFPDFSRPEVAANLMEFPLLTTLPGQLFYYIEKNYLEHKPLLDNKKARNLLLPAFMDASKELLEEEFETVFSDSFWKKIKRKFRYAVDSREIKVIR